MWNPNTSERSLRILGSYFFHHVPDMRLLSINLYFYDMKQRYVDCYADKEKSYNEVEIEGNIPYSLRNVFFLLLVNQET